MTAVLVALISGTVIAAAITTGFLAGLGLAAVVYAYAFGHRIDEAEDRARIAKDAGYRAGLKEGMAAEDRLTVQRDRLEAELRQANVAFDECTGDYAKELVADESWRMAAHEASTT